MDLSVCVKRLLDDKRLGTRTGDEIALTAEAARLVASSALSNDVKDVAIENSPALTAIAVSAMAASAAHHGRGVAEAQHWCDALSTGSIDTNGATRALTCMAHATTSDATGGVLTSWPGCRCGERGRLLGDVCVEGRSVTRPFAEWPVDPRLPGMLEEAITRAQPGLARRDWRLTGLGLLGCQIVRFERGGDVPALASSPSPRVRAGQISGHSAGAACDLVNAWIDGGDGYAVEMAFWALADPGGSRDVAGKASYLRELQQRVAAAGGEGPFFRDYVRRLPPRSRGHDAAYVFAVLRNALVDAGFVVNTPATNAIHFNHIHFHVPASTAVWSELADDRTTPERRERLIESLRPGPDGRSRRAP